MWNCLWRRRGEKKHWNIEAKEHRVKRSKYQAAENNNQKHILGLKHLWTVCCRGSCSAPILKMSYFETDSKQIFRFCQQ